MEDLASEGGREGTCRCFWGVSECFSDFSVSFPPGILTLQEADDTKVPEQNQTCWGHRKKTEDIWDRQQEGQLYVVLGRREKSNVGTADSRA